MKIRNRIKELRNVPASELRPNPKNWRTHPKEQKEALQKGLAEIGIADAVLARELDDGSLMLIDGHLRSETIADTVPVLVLDVTEEESDKLLATFDPLTEMAKQDTEKLSELLKDLKNAGDELTAAVFPDYIIDPLTAADWTPGDIEPVEDEDPDKKTNSSMSFTTEQMEVINQAIFKCREDMDESLGESQCIQLICQRFID